MPIYRTVQIDGFDNQGNPNGSVKAYSSVATLGGGNLRGFMVRGRQFKGNSGAVGGRKSHWICGGFRGILNIPPGSLGRNVARRNDSPECVGRASNILINRIPCRLEWRVGVAAVQMMDNKLNLSLDYGKERDLDGSIYMGAEYWVIPSIALRAGYADSHYRGGSGIRAGLGLKIRDLAFNYAFSPYGDLGMTHRYELSMKFGAIRFPDAHRRKCAGCCTRPKSPWREERYGEATMLLDSLIKMLPNLPALSPRDQDGDVRV